METAFDFEIDNGCDTPMILVRKLWWVSYSITTQIDKGPNVV